MFRSLSFALALFLFLGFSAVAAFVFVNADTYLVSDKYVVAYLGVPAAFAAASLAALALARVRLAILANTVGALLALAAAEIWVAAAADESNNTLRRAELMEDAARERGETADRRNGTQVLLDLRARNLDAYPTWSPTQFLVRAPDPKDFKGPFTLADGRQVLPLTSIARTMSVYCNEGGTRLVFAADRYGFNNSDEIWETTPLDTAFLGDSFAQGACVAPGQDTAALLRARGRKAATMGVGGTGPLIQLGILREYGPIARPKNVFWLFYEANDMHVNLSLESKFSVLNAYLGEGSGGLQTLAAVQPQTDSMLRALIDSRLDAIARSETEVSKPVYGLKDHLKLQALRQKLGLTSCPPRNQNFDLLRAIYARAKAEAAAWGGAVTVVYLPGSDPVCDLFDGESEKAGWMRAGVARAAGAAGVDFVDLTPSLSEGGKYVANFAYPGSHYGPEGYRKLADLIVRRLATN
jgi:hypothetical protein